MLPDCGLADCTMSGVKSKKTRLTYAFTCNVDGCNKLPPMVIGKYKKLWPFGGKTGAELGFEYYHNAKVWMTAVLYQIWITKWDRELTVKGQKVLLLQDNFTGHISPRRAFALSVSRTFVGGHKFPISITHTITKQLLRSSTLL